MTIQGPIRFPDPGYGQDICFYGPQDSEPVNFYKEISASYFMSQPRERYNWDPARYTRLEVNSLRAHQQEGIGLSTVANNGIVLLKEWVFNETGFLFVQRGDGLAPGIFYLQGNNHAVIEMSDPTNAYTTTLGTANKTNIGWDSAQPGYVLQNKNGGPQSYSVHLLGWNN